jgi:hypothetical protein
MPQQPPPTAHAPDGYTRSFPADPLTSDHLSPVSSGPEFGRIDHLLTNSSRNSVGDPRNSAGSWVWPVLGR